MNKMSLLAQMALLYSLGAQGDIPLIVPDDEREEPAKPRKLTEIDRQRILKAQANRDRKAAKRQAEWEKQEQRKRAASEDLG